MSSCSLAGRSDPQQHWLGKGPAKEHDPTGSFAGVGPAKKYNSATIVADDRQFFY